MDRVEEETLVVAATPIEAPPLMRVVAQELIEEPNISEAESSPGLVSKFLGLFAPKNKSDTRDYAKDVKLESVLKFK